MSGRGRLGGGEAYINPARALRAVQFDAAMRLAVPYLEAHESIPSTNAAALDDDREGVVVVGLEQTAGRGRTGTTWLSPRGGLYLSYAPPAFLVPTRPTDMTLVAGLAVADAIQTVLANTGVGQPPVRLKWPNDVLLRERKVAGVLVQSRTPPGPLARPSRAIVGVGINVNTPIVFPSRPEGKGPLPVPPICMREVAGVLLPLETLLVVTVSDMVHRLESGFTRKALEEYKMRCVTIGAQVSFSEGQERLSGRAVDVDIDGALVVELEGGARKRVSSGEVHHMREVR